MTTKKQRPPTRLSQAEFARRIGVSYRTVSRVFNRHANVNEATRRMVEDAAVRQGYQHHIAARSLRLNRTFTVGLVLGNEALHYWADFQSALEQELRRHGYYVMICHRRDGAADSQPEIRLLLQRSVDAVILVPGPGDKASSARLVQAAGCPLLLFDQKIPRARVSFLGTDSRQGSRRLCDHLLDLGHRHIAFLAGPRGLHTSEQRLAGYREAMKRARIPLKHQPVAFAGSWDRSDAERLTGWLLKLEPRPTAVMAANDSLAIGLHHGLRLAGVPIPGDISLTGYAGETTGELISPTLTTMAQPVVQLGGKAAEIILNLIQTPGAPPTSTELPDTLILRASSAPPTPARKRKG